MCYKPTGTGLANLLNNEKALQIQNYTGSVRKYRDVALDNFDARPNQNGFLSPSMRH